MEKHPAVYIMSNMRNGTLYVGVTSDLARRVSEHREGYFGGFTKRYSLGRLVWFERFPNMTDAIAREKQLKKWNRQWKLKLIESINPEWRDLSSFFF